MSRVAKKFRLLRRHGDGSAVYECSDAEGYEQVSIHADGSRSIYAVAGICGDCMAGRHARADCPWRDRDTTVTRRHDGVERGADVPVAVEPIAGVVKPIRRAEPPAEPAPDPVDEKLDRDAQMVARSVWFRGGQHRNQLFQGRSQISADALLARAVAMQWVSARDDGMIVPGTVNPVPVMPGGGAIPTGAGHQLGPWTGRPVVSTRRVVDS
jgi:hypothetical protein